MLILLHIIIQTKITHFNNQLDIYPKQKELLTLRRKKNFNKKFTFFFNFIILI